MLISNPYPKGIEPYLASVVGKNAPIDLRPENHAQPAGVPDTVRLYNILQLDIGIAHRGARHQEFERVGHA